MVLSNEEKSLVAAAIKNTQQARKIRHSLDLENKKRVANMLKKAFQPLRDILEEYRYHPAIAVHAHETGVARTLTDHFRYSGTHDTGVCFWDLMGNTGPELTVQHNEQGDYAEYHVRDSRHSDWSIVLADDAKTWLIEIIAGRLKDI